MKKFILLAGLALTPMAVSAQEPPKTLELPTVLVDGFRQYLSTRPYAEVRDGLAALDACISAQLPQGGLSRDGGGCPAVAAAMAARRIVEAELAKLKATLAEAGKPPADPPKAP